MTGLLYKNEAYTLTSVMYEQVRHPYRYTWLSESC